MGCCLHCIPYTSLEVSLPPALPRSSVAHSHAPLLPFLAPSLLRWLHLPHISLATSLPRPVPSSHSSMLALPVLNPSRNLPCRHSFPSSLLPSHRRSLPLSPCSLPPPSHCLGAIQKRPMTIFFLANHYLFYNVCTKFWAAESTQQFQQGGGNVLAHHLLFRAAGHSSSVVPMINHDISF